MDHQLLLEEKQEDGKTYKIHLEALSARRGKPHPDLIGPEMPEAGQHIWQWFCALAAASPEGITYREIEAWSRLTGHQPTPQEVRLIMQLEGKRRAR